VFAVETTAEGIDLEMVGWILIGLGVVGLVASAIFWSSLGMTGRRHRSVTERHSTPTGDVVVQDDVVR
jgi:hypothetical protein